MVFGGPDVEHIQLNEETVWSGGPNNNINPNAQSDLQEIRRLIFSGRYKDAQDLVASSVITRQNHGMAYQPVGDVYLMFPGHEDYTDFRRELDLADAVAVTSYKVNGVTYRREYFTSLTDDVVVIRLSASGKGNLNFRVKMDSPLSSSVAVGPDGIVIRGRSSDMEGLEGK